METAVIYRDVFTGCNTLEVGLAGLLFRGAGSEDRASSSSILHATLKYVLGPLCREPNIPYLRNIAEVILGTLILVRVNSLIKRYWALWVQASHQAAVQQETQKESCVFHVSEVLSCPSLSLHPKPSNRKSTTSP